MEFLRRLFRPASTREDTAPAPTVTPSETLIGWATDVGLVRSHNEDAVLTIQANQTGGESLAPFCLVVLADGMGGHKSGEVASAMAVRRVAHHITKQIYLHTLVDTDRGADQPSLSEVLIEAVNIANSMVATRVSGGGTTLTCALLIGHRAHIAHVGDSRAYLVSNSSLSQITRDHSLVDRLVEMGQLTHEEAANHPQKNVLYRAVGQSGVLEVDTFVQTIPAGGQLLLCSDGLWSMLSDDEICEIIAQAPSIQAACEALVVAANEAGGKDNITAVLLLPPAEG